MDSSTFDVREAGVRICKYALEGLAVAVAAYFIPGRKLHWEEILVLGLLAAATFAVLDLFVPAVGDSARAGAGLAIGVQVAGGLAATPLGR